MECDNNRLDGMCHLGVIQLNLVFIIIFSFCATWISQVQGFRRPKLLRKKSVLSILFWNLQFTRTNEHYRFFENGKTKKRSRFAPLSQADICVDVQELTENIEIMNAKSLN